MIEWWWSIVVGVGVVAICKFAFWIKRCIDESKELRRLREKEEKDRRNMEKSLFKASIMDDVIAYCSGLSKRQDQIFDRVRKIETEVREMQNKMEKGEVEG